MAGVQTGELTQVTDRSINFHEPLSEVPLYTEPGIDLRIYAKRSCTEIEVSSPVAIKGLLIEATDASGFDADAVEFADNGFDLVPGELVRFGVKGLKQGDEARLVATWLGKGHIEHNSISQIASRL